MRIIIVLSLFLATALALPVPASAPIPVSTPVISAAPLDQSGIRVASNGSIALAVWNDRRVGRSDVTATRITADGHPLDPIGIVVRENAVVLDIYWNGTAFVVVTGNFGEDFVARYVTPEGEVTEGDVLAPDWMSYAARTGEGASARFLFLSGDGSPALARVVDSHGSVIEAGDYHGGESPSVLAVGTGSGFLELRGVSPNPYLAYTLDRDGKVVESKDSQLPAALQGVALTPDGHGGFALFGVISRYQLVVVRLDANGVATGPPQVLVDDGSYNWLPNGQTLTVAAASDGYVATWFDRSGRAYVSRNGGAPVMAFDCDCFGFGVDAAYEPVNDLLLLSYDSGYSSNADVYVRKGNADPVVLTHAAQRQTSAAIATGANGFLVAWAETDATENAYVYVRRYAPDATPLDDVQVAATDSIHDGTSPFGNIAITSSGDGYLVTWERYGFFWSRRMNARSGEWIDDKPFVIDPLVAEIAAASNGKDALAITVGSCRSEDSCSAGVRTISMSGGSPGSAVKLSDIPVRTRPAIASNGTDYLAAWTECLSSCSPDSHGATRVAVMRLHADGTHIDATPIVLEPASEYFADLAAAWNGQTYLVTWSAGTGVRAAYIGADGTVQQLGSIPGFRGAPKIVAHDGEFLLLDTNFLGYGEPYELRVTLLDGSSTIIATQPSDAFGPIDGASDGVHLMLTYDRVDEAAGRVGRVFIDPRVLPANRKRAVR